MPGIRTVVLPGALLGALALAGPAPAAGTDALREAISEIRAAALASDPSRAEHHLARNLRLISQSGKVYGRDDMLRDLATGAERWTVLEEEIEKDGSLARVTARIERKRPGAEPMELRVLQLWRTTAQDRWELFAQATVRLAR